MYLVHLYETRLGSQLSKACSLIYVGGGGGIAHPHLIKENASYERQGVSIVGYNRPFSIVVGARKFNTLLGGMEGRRFSLVGYFHKPLLPITITSNMPFREQTAMKAAQTASL